MNDLMCGLMRMTCYQMHRLHSNICCIGNKKANSIVRIRRKYDKMTPDLFAVALGRRIPPDLFALIKFIEPNTTTNMEDIDPSGNGELMPELKVEGAYTPTLIRMKKSGCDSKKRDETARSGQVVPITQNSPRKGVNIFDRGAGYPRPRGMGAKVLGTGCPSYHHLKIDIHYMVIVCRLEEMRANVPGTGCPGRPLVKKLNLLRIMRVNLIKYEGIYILCL